MLALLSLLPRASTTFLFALAALLRFYGTDSGVSAHHPLAGFPLLGWSLTAFVLASAALVVDLGLEWNRVVGTRARADRERDQERRRRDRAARQSDLQARCLLGLLSGQRRDTSANRRRLQALIAELAPRLTAQAR